MAKSPINLLQEFSIKEGYYPLYEINMMTNDNSKHFECRVTCKNTNAVGRGFSKKDAKQKAAENMLSLLNIKNEIFPIVDNIQNSTLTEICKTSPLTQTHLAFEVTKVKQDIDENVVKTQSSSNYVNYIGLLQEFCAQQNLTTKHILYKVVDESGPPHMRYFTIEVNVGSLREQGSARCKKVAKQEAAKNLLQRLKPNHLHELNKNEASSEEMLEDNIRKLGVTISESKINEPTLPIAELSKEAYLRYIECTNKMTNKVIEPRHQFLIKDFHGLFEKTYSSKIPCNMKEKMQIIRDIYIDQINMIQEMRRDIERVLEVKIEQFILPSSTKGYAICIRLKSSPIIAQVGTGETKAKAEIRAMYNVIVTILTLIN